MIRIEGLYPMTPQQIKVKLSQPCFRSCDDCYFHKACLRYAGYLARAYIERLEKDATAAQARIEELETNINLMKIQMMGDCGCCKHKKIGPDVCAYCMSKKERPYWEYEGLPGVRGSAGTEKKGES